MRTELVEAAMEKLPQLVIPLEALMEPFPNRARLDPPAMVVAPL